MAVETPEQVTAIAAARTLVARRWAQQDDFVGAVLLRGREHNRLTAYSQWRIPAAGAPPEVPESWSLQATLKKAVDGAHTLDARTYSLAFTDGNVPRTEISLEETPIVHFGIFTFPLGNQDKLIELAREYGPKSLPTPGLMTINSHRSVDGLEVINLGTWRSFRDFEKLIEQPGFADGEVYWEGVSDFQPDFFDVVDVKTPVH